MGKEMLQEMIWTKSTVDSRGRAEKQFAGT